PGSLEEGMEGKTMQIAVRYKDNFCRREQIDNRAQQQIVELPQRLLRVGLEPSRVPLRKFVGPPGPLQLVAQSSCRMIDIRNAGDVTPETYPIGRDNPGA